MDPAGIDRLHHNEEPRRDVATDVSRAREALEQARAEVDLALAALPHVDGDEAMATPALLLLLIGAVTAKRHLTNLEALMAPEPGEHTMTALSGRILG
jgi:hypothetical protein